jgi:hypothetical protein
MSYALVYLVFAVLILKMHATCFIQLELHCVNQAHDSSMSYENVQTNVFQSRLHATILGKSCVV